MIFFVTLKLLVSSNRLVPVEAVIQIHVSSFVMSHTVISISVKNRVRTKSYSSQHLYSRFPINSSSRHCLMSSSRTRTCFALAAFSRHFCFFFSLRFLTSSLSTVGCSPWCTSPGWQNMKSTSSRTALKAAFSVFSTA